MLKLQANQLKSYKLVRMLAVIKTGGKQYIVEPKKRLKVEKLGNAQGEDVQFGEVLLVGEPDGSTVSMGTPALISARVSARVLGHGRARKIKMLKYKPKKRYRLRKGHRQHYTEIEITGIEK